MRVLPRVLLVVALIYAAVILVVILSGPFRFELGPLRVSVSSLPKPILIALGRLAGALFLSTGVREALRRSSVIGFYLLAAVATWMLALGPVLTLMGTSGRRGPYFWLMALPGMDGLRVPARFWLMTVLCLCVVAGLVVAEITSRRSRRIQLVIVLLAGMGVLTDGWIDRIEAASLPAAVPGAELLPGATVLEAPMDLFHDVTAVYRAVIGGWHTVNGYSGWGPSYYHALTAASGAAAPALVTPFQQQSELHVLVQQDAPGLLALIERQPGVTKVASNSALVHYRLPRRGVLDSPRPQGLRLPVREARSSCSSWLQLTMDSDEDTIWQCDVDRPQEITLDLGTPVTVGSIVHGLGSQTWLFPGGLQVETSLDGLSWTAGWDGDIFQTTILAAMKDPTRLQIVLAFEPRPARFVRLRATLRDPVVPWSISELEVWSASSDAR